MASLPANFDQLVKDGPSNSFGTLSTVGYNIEKIKREIDTAMN